MTPKRRSVVHTSMLLLKVLIVIGLAAINRGCAWSCEVGSNGQGRSTTRSVE